MNLTISLEEPVSGHLREQASSRSLSPEQAARDILSSALVKLAEDERWRPLNQRRCDLIRQGRGVALTTEDRAELDQLQNALDAQLESVDQQMIATAELFLQRAKGLRDATKP